MATATFTADWSNCAISPMVAWPGGEAPAIFENAAMPQGEECGARGDGIVSLPFVFDATETYPVFTLDYTVSSAGDSISGTTLNEIMLLTEDETSGVSFEVSRVDGAQFVDLRIYVVRDGVRQLETQTNMQSPWGWESKVAVGDSAPNRVQFTFDSVAVNTQISDFNTLMEGVSKIVWHGTDGVGTALIDLTISAEGVTVKPVDARLRVLSGDKYVEFGVGNIAAEEEEADVRGMVSATNPLRIAFPHDVIFTSGPGAAPYSGYFWPPSTPIPPSQIYIPRGPDPITAEPNFKRMQWTVTTADTPREIQMGETPGFSYGDPDAPPGTVPPSNC